MLTIPIVVVGSAEFQLKFFTTETPPNPLPNIATNLINTPILTTFMLDATTVFTPMVIIHASSD